VPYVRAIPINQAVDSSFLVHATIPSQATPDAIALLRELRNGDLGASPGTHLEFTSFLRKLVTQRRVTREAGQRMLDAFLELEIEPLPFGPTELREAWDVATQLNQGDVFDSMGYVLARSLDAEFVTCDRRFANAAGAQGLEGVRFVS
jgi:predicted nucleic acid-binding protein